jgi:PAS domain S-box-containing protein
VKTRPIRLDWTHADSANHWGDFVLHGTKSIRLALIAAVLVVNAFVVFVLAGKLIEAREQAEREVQVTTQNMALLLDHGVTEMTKKIDLSLRSGVEELEKMLRSSRGLDDTAGVEALLAERSAWLSGIADFRITDASGAIKFGPGVHSEANVSYADRAFFIALRDRGDAGLVVSDPLLGRVTGKWAIAFGRRYNTPDGRFAGVIVAGVPVSQFAQLLSGLDVGPHGVALLRATDTGLIAHQPDATAWFAQIGAKKYSRELAEIIASGVATRTFHTRESGDNFERTNTFRRLSSPPFYLVVGKGSDDYLAIWQGEVKRAIATGVIFFAVTTLLAWLLWRSLLSVELAVAGRERAAESLEASEALLRSTFEQAAVGIAHVDPETFHVLIANDKFCDLLGYAKQELVGTDSRCLIPADELPSHIAERKALLAGQLGSSSSERLLVKKGGALAWFSRSLSLVRASDGTPRYFISVIEDISARKGTEARLRKVERARRVLGDCSGVMVHAQDEAELLHGMCRTAVESGGYRMAAVAYAEHDQGKTVRTVAQAGFEEGYLAQAKLSWADNEHGRGPAGQAIRGGRPVVVRNAQTDPSFAPWRESALQRGFNAVITLPLSSQGEPFGVLGLYASDVDAFDTDEVALLEQLAADLAYGITSLRTRVAQARTEGELAKLNAELEMRVAHRTAALQEVNRQLESFSYTVAHDLRTPLRAINGFSAIVAMENEGKLDAASCDYLKRIRVGSERMGQLVDDLLDLTRLSRQAVRWQDFDLSACAAGAVAALSEAHPERQVSIAIQPGMMAHGDPGLIAVVLENLIGNAWKFTAETGSATIEVATVQVDGALAYAVRDNGAGFDMRYATKLFEPFQRLHEPDRFEGTGIGLATVKNIILRHGGRIWIDSAVGRGTNVFFTLGNPA